MSYRAVGELKFPSTLFKGWQVQDSVLVAHRNERNPPSKERRLISKPSLRTQPTSRPPPSFPLPPSHPTPSPPLPTANRPRLHLSPVSSVPAPTSGFLALPQGSERPIGALPLCTICIGALLLYRFGSVIRGHSVVGGRSGCWRSPHFSSDKAR